MKSFIFEDTLITDPTLDETGRFQVNPKEYYKEQYINSLKKLNYAIYTNMSKY